MLGWRSPYLKGVTHGMLRDAKIRVGGRSRGFSLMELMAALVIMGVVALLGYRTVFDSISVNLDEARLSVLSALRSRSHVR